MASLVLLDMNSSPFKRKVAGSIPVEATGSEKTESNWT